MKKQYTISQLNEWIRDRFVAGCLNEKIRERLLMEKDDLTLDQALDFARNMEACIGRN